MPHGRDLQKTGLADVRQDDRAPDHGLNFGDMRHNTGFLLRLAWLQARQSLDQNEQSLGLTAAEYTVLRLIAQTPGVRQGHLAQALYIKPAAMTRMVRGFEDRDLVERHIPDGDRRTVRLTIRPKGQQALDRERARFSGALDTVGTQISADEQAELNHLLRKFCGLSPEGLSQGT